MTRTPLDLAALAAEVVDRTVTVAQVPAPTGGEHQRAALVADWWRPTVSSPSRLTNPGNVWARVHDGRGPAIVLAAHLDTVFGPERPTSSSGPATG